MRNLHFLCQLNRTLVKPKFFLKHSLLSSFLKLMRWKIEREGERERGKEDADRRVARKGRKKARSEREAKGGKT